jgi:diadenosine tetraphosphate (Ap4A) HIT family hydrolase
VQSNPFQHLASATTTAAETIDHTGRFIGIAKVSTPTDAAPKPPKYIHALGLTPLHNMASNSSSTSTSTSNTQELVSTTPNIQPNPFTDASYERDGTSRSNQHVGLSEAQARRIMGETNRGHDYRWTATTTKRGPVDETSVDETITTLFLHGLHKDVTNRLQTGSGALLQAFDKYKVLKVRRPPAASSYAFLEFDTHAHAQHCLHDLAGEITIAGIHLTLKWASQGGQVEQRAPKRPRLTEQDAKASSTLYFRLPPARETDPEQLRKYMETTLEQALGGDVTAETEPALQVSTRLTLQTNFGFMEFASHAAASMVLATLTGSTDGGSMVSTEDAMIPEGLLGILLFWAPDKAAATPTDQTMTTASGVVFSRQHFPADSRQDCWFCLASPGCEKHLITSVFQQCYLAMPKGPIHPGHVLIIPVTHTSQGALSDASLQEELADLKQRLYRHAKEQYQCDLFVWERAIQTKGGYHTHLQCVPVAPDMALQLSATITALAKKSGFALREINSDLGLQALTQEGYFYAEIISTHTKRFLHPAEESSRVPLQFGREVLAVVMDRPELAHWKACVLDKEKEQELALEFRKSFETYEPKDECGGEPKIVQQAW